MKESKKNKMSLKAKLESTPKSEKPFKQSKALKDDIAQKKELKKKMKKAKKEGMLITLSPKTKKQVKIQEDSESDDSEESEELDVNKSQQTLQSDSEESIDDTQNVSQKNSTQDKIETDSDDESENDKESSEEEEENEDEEEEEQNGDESSDDESNVKNKKAPKEKIPETPERLARTVFVGNVNIEVTTDQLKKLFTKYGIVESVRLRGIAPALPGLPKNVAYMLKMFHPKRTSLLAYVVFEKREDALKSLELNGTKHNEHYLRVKISSDTEYFDIKKSIGIGNLPLDVEDNDLWEAFLPYGEIDCVRVVRDKTTNIGVGYGYVNFKSQDSVELALTATDVEIKGRDARIERQVDRPKKKTGPKPWQNQRSPNFHQNRGGFMQRQQRPFVPYGNKPFFQNRPFNQGGNRPFNRGGNRPFNQGGNRFFNQGGNRPFIQGGNRPFFKNQFHNQGQPMYQNPRFNNAEGGPKPFNKFNKNKDLQGSKVNQHNKKKKIDNGTIRKMKLSKKIAPKVTE